MTRRTGKLGRPARFALVGAAFFAPPGVAVSGASSCEVHQDEKVQKDQKDEKVQAEVIEAKQAKALLKAEKKALADKEPRVRKEAIERLARYSNEELVKTFNNALKDRDEGVVLAAISALGHQPAKKATTALMRLLANKKYGEHETYSVHVIRSLGRVGWDKKHYAVLRKQYNSAKPAAKREILRAFAAQKEKQAFSLFVDNLDEPRPKAVNSPNNPPASYWKARYKEWTLIKVDVRRGLQAVAGREFKDSAEAREWAKSRDARKAGIRYKSGS